MSGNDFEVLPISDEKYDKAVQGYWKWLLGYPNADPDSQPVVDGIFYTRAYSNYTNSIKDHTVAQRVNLPASKGSRINTVGAKQDPLSIDTQLIFVTFIDTFINNTYINPDNGREFSTPEMNEVLTTINNTLTAGDMKATIERIGSGEGPQPIVQNMFQQRLQVPTSSKDERFPVDIDKESTLADKLEFIQPRGRRVTGRAEGFYALISIKKTGIYHIVNSSSGVRNYKDHKDYHISVKA